MILFDLDVRGHLAHADRIDFFAAASVKRAARGQGIGTGRTPLNRLETVRFVAQTGDRLQQGPGIRVSWLVENSGYRPGLDNAALTTHLTSLLTLP